jgi:hypothetical protein
MGNGLSEIFEASPRGFDLAAVNRGAALLERAPRCRCGACVGARAKLRYYVKFRPSEATSSMLRLEKVIPHA